MTPEPSLINFPLSDLERVVLKSAEDGLLIEMADALDHNRIIGEGPAVARIRAVRMVGGKERLVTIRIEVETVREDA